MAANTLYKEVLLEHFHQPRNKGGLQGADVLRRGSNPRCGDEIEVGLFLQGDRLERVKFRGRGCSVCIASASLMTEALYIIGILWTMDVAMRMAAIDKTTSRRRSLDAPQ